MMIQYQLNIDGLNKLLKDLIVPSNPLIVLPVDMEVMKVLFIALLFVLLIIFFLRPHPYSYLKPLNELDGIK